MRVPRTSTVLTGVSAVLLTTTALAAPAVAEGPVTPTPIDTVQPVDVAARGTTVAWLRPTSKPRRDGTVRRTRAVVLDAPGATPRVLSATLPDDADAIAVGTDARGRTVLLVEGTGGPVVLPADGTGAPKRVAGLTSKDSAVSMREGRIAFVRTSRDHARVRTATAPGRTSRARYTVPDEYEAVDLELGARDAVALQATRPRDAGIADIAWLVRPGKAVRRLTSQSTGGASENGMGGLVSSAAGRTFSVSRWNLGGGHPNDLQRFSASTGKRLARRTTTSVATVEAAIELALDPRGSVVTPVQVDGCKDPQGPGPAGLPACPWLGVVR